MLQTHDVVQALAGIVPQLRVVVFEAGKNGPDDRAEEVGEAGSESDAAPARGSALSERLDVRSDAR